MLDFEGMSLNPAENLVLRMAPDFMWQAASDDDELAGARVYAVKKGERCNQHSRFTRLGAGSPNWPASALQARWARR